MTDRDNRGWQLKPVSRRTLVDPRPSLDGEIVADLNANKSLVERWLHALSSKHFDEAWGLVAPGGTYWLLRQRKSMSIPEIAPALEDRIRTKFVDGLLFEPRVLTAEEDRVAAVVDAQGTLITGGDSYETFYHFLFVIKEAQIEAIWEYGDTYQSWRTFTVPSEQN